MLNALWFKPEGGAEKYRKYLEVAGPITQKYQAKHSARMALFESLLGEFDADLVFLSNGPVLRLFNAS